MSQHIRASGRARRCLEFEVQIDGGTPDKLVAVVAENSQMLKFTTQGFEEE
jgi:hypothetical protein